ncbi:MAG: hypothetical protein MZW92_32990 [Comamonadaceae bacterium]|nr:hypothetical protein [Comamonadaceae bacterium]
MNGPIGAEVQRHAGQGARHAHPRHDVLRHAPHHDDEQGGADARRHGRLQAARARERRVQGDGRGLGREADADELRRALPRAQAERGRRPGEPAADDQVGQVRRGAEVPGADRPHHHAAPGRRERGVLAGAGRRRPRRSSRTRSRPASPGRTRSCSRAGEARWSTRSRPPA